MARWVNKEKAMPPMSEDAILVKGSITIACTSQHKEYKEIDFELDIDFVAILEGDIYCSDWRQSLDKATITDCTHLEIHGDDIRPYNVKQFVCPGKWFFNLSNINEWVSLDKIKDSDY